ncbi:MAG: adenosylcobinamide-GDP ribazoletransferase [Eubacteriales bacterium]
MGKLKQMWNSLIICTSMYSIIPMPRIDWEENSMKYMLCFLPVIGGFIGICMIGFYYLLTSFTVTFQAIALLFTPVIVSGGIHMDGLIDTCDAYFSYGDKEKKLEILKDPRTGAFGVIGAIVYFVCLYGIYVQLIETNQLQVIVLPIIFIFSRAVGAICMIKMPNAKNDGLGAGFSNVAEQKIVVGILGVWILVSAMILGMIDRNTFIIFVVTIAIFLLAVLPLYKKKFGGITGDLTGCIISLLELLLPLSMAIGGVLL